MLVEISRHREGGGGVGGQKHHSETLYIKMSLIARLRLLIFSGNPRGNRNHWGLSEVFGKAELDRSTRTG